MTTNIEAERALLQIERVANRRFPELGKFIRSTDLPLAVARELQQLALVLGHEVSAAERRGERKFMTGRVR